MRSKLVSSASRSSDMTCSFVVVAGLAQVRPRAAAGPWRQPPRSQWKAAELPSDIRQPWLRADGGADRHGRDVRVEGARVPADDAPAGAVRRRARVLQRDAVLARRAAADRLLASGAGGERVSGLTG